MIKNEKINVIFKEDLFNLITNELQISGDNNYYIKNDKLKFLFNLTDELKFTTLNKLLGKVKFMELNEAMESTDIIQLVSYVYFLNENTDEILYFKRDNNLVSIGFGEHLKSNNTIIHNIYYQLFELFKIKVDLDKLQLIGFIYYNKPPISLYHLGIIFKYDLDDELFNKMLTNTKIKINKIKKNDLNKLNLEDWSKFIKQYKFDK